MIGLAAVLATVVSAVLAIPLALAADYLNTLPEIVQMTALVGAVAVYFGFWFLAFNLFCEVLKVSK
jgi:ABC-type Mn2+/Zn2+ transport system permease subunit